MQVLLEIEELSDIIEDLDNPLYEKEAKAKTGLRDGDSIACVNIGPGADWLVLLATFDVVWTIFRIPGIVKKSIEGWEWLITKLKGFIKKKQLVSLDLDAAGLLAIDYLADKYGDASDFNLEDAHAFKISDFSGMFPNQSNSLAAHPHNYYVFTFHIAGRIVVLSVRSTGEIKELEAFGDMPYGLMVFAE